jgi:hypothetical protein
MIRRPTATAIAKKNALFHSRLVTTFIRKTRGTLTAMSWVICHVKRLRPRSKLVGGASSAIEPAMAPR